MKQIVKVIFAVLFLSALGCAKDRDLDEYKRDKALKDLARYQAIEGTYTGLVTSSATNRVIGALQIKLHSRLKTNDATDGSADSGAPILVSELTLEGPRTLSLSIPGGYYDPDSGIFQSDIAIKRQDNTRPDAKISITGNVGGGSFNGSIQALGYTDEGNNFSLSLNGKDIDTLAQDAKVTANALDETVLELTSYVGTTTFSADGVSKPMRLVILQPRTGGDEDFADFLSPVKTVQVSLNYDKSAHILNTGAIWDLRKNAGLLTGQVMISQTIVRSGVSTTQPTTLSLNCNTAFNAAGGSVSCTHFTTDSASPIATTQALLETTPGTDPTDTSGTSSAQKHEFLGHAMILPDDPKGGRKIWLNVVYPARSRMEDIYDLFLPNSERTMQVTFILSDTTSISFNGGQWDSTTGALDATSSLDSSGSPGVTSPGGTTPGGPGGTTPGGNGSGGNFWTPELHCIDFYFLATTKPFTCVYSSNRSGAINLNFQP